MSRRKKNDGPETAPSDAGATVTLRLKQNDFVRGAFAPGGSLHDFSPEEAKRRLRTTDLWEHA